MSSMLDHFSLLDGMPEQPPIWSVYTFIRDDGLVLYVGFTGRGRERVAAHVKRQFWRSASEIRLEHFVSEEDAREREKELIGVLAPLYNVQHQIGRRSPVRLEGVLP